MMNPIQSRPPDKQKDKWKQFPEDAESFIKDLTLPTETVLDPFCGTGTFGIAALRNNRKFIGIDINPDKCKHATANLAKQLEEQEKKKEQETKGEGVEK